MATMDTENGVRDIIYVPIGQTEEAVALPVDDLPDDPSEVLVLLQQEFAPLDIWLDIAKAYLQQGKEENFHAILSNATEDGASSRPAPPPPNRDRARGPWKI